MGNKNRIFLGILHNVILHNFRNIITEKELYITKLKIKKIQNKHPEIVHYILENKFQDIIDNTVGSCSYDEEGIYNLLSLIDGRYILFSISTNNFYLEGGTLFYTSKRQLKKCMSSVRFFSSAEKEKFEIYMKEN